MNKAAIWWLALFCGFLFINTLNNDFTYDDIQVIKNSRFITGDVGIKDLLNESRPVRTVSLILDYKLFGLNPIGYHIQNIFWHGLSAVLLYFFLLRVSRDQAVSLMASILFASHPVHVEAVANISHRKELLCLSFSLISLLLYLKSYEYKGFLRYTTIITALLSFALALLSKQVAAFLPLMAIFYELYFIPQCNKRLLLNNYKYLIIVGLISILYGVYYAIPAYNNFFIEKAVWYNITYTEYLSSTIKANLYYLRLLLWPVNQSPHHPFPAPGHITDMEVLSALSLLILLFWTAIKLRKKAVLISFGILWYFATLLPVMLIPGTAHLLAERYLYIPSVGFVLVAGYAISKLLDRGRIITGLLIAIISFYSINTVDRNLVWRDEYSLWLDAAKKEPKSWLAHNNLGNIYQKMGRLNEAKTHYAEALKLRPNDPVIRNNLGTLYDEMGLLEDAVIEFQTAINLKHDYADAYYNLGGIYRKLRSFDKSIEAYEMALKFNPSFFKAYNNLGAVYADKGLYDKAINQYVSALKLNPTYATAYNNMGIALALQGRLEEAVQQFNNAIKYDPGSSDAHKNLDMALNLLKNKKE